MSGLPAYQVVVLHPASGSVTALFDASSFYEMRYSRALNDIGAIAITLPSTPEIRAAFMLDSFVEVYRERENGKLEKEETYLVRLMHRFIEGDEERFIVGGVSLNHLIARRIVDPDDDPLVAGGYSTKSGPADQVIFDYCYEQMGIGASVARRTIGLSIAPVSGIGRPIGARLRYESLFEQVQGFSRAGAVDFQIVRSSGANLELQIGKIGKDRTNTTNSVYHQPSVALTPLRGNLTKPSLLSDRKGEANFAYVLGQGQRDRRIVYKAAGVGITDSPNNRIEFAEDARNVEQSDALGLITSANAVLQDHRLKNEFTYEPTGVEPGNTYHEDWDLGDAITIDWDETLLDLRIVGIEISIGADGETITTSVTDDFVFPGGVIEADVELPTRATMFMNEAIALVGGWATSQNNSQTYDYYLTNGSDANGDSFSLSFFIAAGAYTLNVLGLTIGGCAMADWYIDDLLVVTGQDWYSAGPVWNVIKFDAVNVLWDGYHTLKCVINGRNASAVAWHLDLTKVWLKQVVD